jgi:hypothetical protein
MGVLPGLAAYERLGLFFAVVAPENELLRGAR